MPARPAGVERIGFAGRLAGELRHLPDEPAGSESFKVGATGSEMVNQCEVHLPGRWSKQRNKTTA
jgi:hypothetical protein